MADSFGLTSAQQKLIDQANQKLTSGDRIGLELAQQINLQIISPLVKLYRSSTSSPLFGLPQDQLFQVTRVFMQTRLETTADDVLRSGPGLISALYSETAKKFNFVADASMHAEEMKILFRIEYESLTLSRPNDTLKAATRILIGREPTAAIMKNFENAGITLSSIGPVAEQKNPQPPTRDATTPAKSQASAVYQTPPPPLRPATPPPLPLGSTTPPPLSVRPTTPPPIPVKSATPPPIPVRSTTPPPIPPQATTPPPIPVRSATPPPIPTRPATLPTATRPTTPPPRPARPSTPPTLPRRFSESSGSNNAKHALFASPLLPMSVSNEQKSRVTFANIESINSVSELKALQKIAKEVMYVSQLKFNPAEDKIQHWRWSSTRDLTKDTVADSFKICQHEATVMLEYAKLNDAILDKLIKLDKPKPGWDFYQSKKANSKEHVQFLTLKVEDLAKDIKMNGYSYTTPEADGKQIESPKRR